MVSGTTNEGTKKLFSETHGHMVGSRGEQNLDQVITKAEQAQVVLVLTAGIDLPSSVQAVEAAKKYSIVKACVGIHPWYADEYNAEAHESLSALIENNAVVAVSEIGLDFFGRMEHDGKRSEKYVAEEIQQKTFRGQLRLAKEKGLPVIVHDRARDSETLEIMKEQQISKFGGAIHGFTGNLGLAKKCIDSGILISVSERALTRPENEELRRAIGEIPLEWLLTETDSGSPDGVVKVAERIADLKGLTPQHVGNQTTSNLKRLLRIPG